MWDNELKLFAFNNVIISDRLMCSMSFVKKFECNKDSHFDGHRVSVSQKLLISYMLSKDNENVLYHIIRWLHIVNN
jgi:hypothetical protein